MRNMNSVKVRRDHKDTLFRMIFSTRENLLSLYNAVNHSHYTDAKELEIVTLENAVYMTFTLYGCKRVGDRDAGKCSLYEYEK